LNRKGALVARTRAGTKPVNLAVEKMKGGVNGRTSRRREGDFSACRISGKIKGKRTDKRSGEVNKSTCADRLDFWKMRLTTRRGGERFIEIMEGRRWRSGENKETGVSSGGNRFWER